MKREVFGYSINIAEVTLACAVFLRLICRRSGSLNSYNISAPLVSMLFFPRLLWGVCSFLYVVTSVAEVELCLAEIIMGI